MHVVEPAGKEVANEFPCKRDKKHNAGRYVTINEITEGGAGMGHYAIRIAVTALIVVAIAEIAKRSAFWAAALASLPLTSLLAFAWLYRDTGDAQRVAALSQSVFWLVLPSLPLFLLLPALLRAGTNFWLSLTVSCVATAVAYAVMIWFLARLGVRL